MTKVVNRIAELIRETSSSLPEDAERALRAALRREAKGSSARLVLETILKNVALARAAGTPEAYPVRAARKAIPVRRRQAAVVTDGQGRVLLVQNAEGGLLKGLWDLPSLAPAFVHTQTFSHFKLELDVLHASVPAVFADPRLVPLTTAARKVLARCGCLETDA